MTAVRRSASFGLHLTDEHELFLAYGLPAGIALLALATGALTLAGLGTFLTGEVRIVAIALYALLIAPLAHVLLANRCLRALLANARSMRQSRQTRADGTHSADTAIDPALPPNMARSELGATLLCAARSAQVSLALAALEHGADPDTRPAPELRDQRSAMMIAVTLPDTRLLRALIAKGADVNSMYGGLSPLIAATRDSYAGRPEVVSTLLANGADPRMVDATGMTSLHNAACCAEPILAALLLDAAAPLDAINAAGMTALAIACSSANWKVAKFLLERGAKIDLQHAQPALVLAAEVPEDDPAGVNLLLKLRAKVDVRAALERTALMAAALAGHVRTVEALLGAGSGVDLTDHRGTTALMEASRAGAVAVIHALAKRKANADSVDHSGRSALIIACQSRHASEETVRALLTLGADRACVGADNKRALDHAAAAGRWHIVALLDPAYPLPASLGNGAPPAQAASADHLLDALRFGHWNVAAEFAGVLAEWPAAAIADLYFELVDAEHAAARTWLLNRGVTSDTYLSDGRALGAALITLLPISCAALHELLARGGLAGGAGIAAHILTFAAAGTDGDATRAVARYLIERGADCFGVASGQRSALHLAALQGDVQLAGTLLDRGVDPNARDAQGRTPLHLAVKATTETAIALVRLLLRAGGNPDIATASGETPLGLALAREESAFGYWLNWSHWRLPMRRLLPVDVPAAAATGDLDAVDRLLMLGMPIDAVDAQGATALIRAAGSGHTALVVHLLEAGADAMHTTRSGSHCLAAAVSAKRDAVVRTVLSHGVEPDLRTGGGATALMLAAAQGQPRIVEALLEAGADVCAVDEHATSALHAAAQFAFQSSDGETARALFDNLLRAGAMIDARDDSGRDALLVLLGANAQPGTRCDAEHLLHLVQWLLERGAQPDAQDQRGVGTLHACALHGLLGCARLLKAHGVPLNLVDGFGRTAADVASLLGYVDVAAELGAARGNQLPGVRQTLRRPARSTDH